ncbi:hypothetical protein KY289_030444 [Solanum tuberosum]|nr:hypothetical protein KY289_030444 [Solanum tuberosum]
MVESGSLFRARRFAGFSEGRRKKEEKREKKMGNKVGILGGALRADGGFKCVLLLWRLVFAEAAKRK